MTVAVQMTGHKPLESWQGFKDNALELTKPEFHVNVHLDKYGMLPEIYSMTSSLSGLPEYPTVKVITNEEIEVLTKASNAEKYGQMDPKVKKLLSDEKISIV